jgi:hypothetical protein
MNKPEYRVQPRALDEKTIFFEEWSPTTILYAADAFADGGLPDALRSAIDPDMRAILTDMHGRRPELYERMTMLYKYWRGRAEKVLGGYRNYARPILDYDRKSQIATERINLLSAKGEALLGALSRGENVEMSAIKGACKKTELNLDLFRDLDPSFDEFDVYPGLVLLRHGDDNSLSLASINRLAAVSGCPHGCPHCAEYAQSRVHSMPFPMYLKVLDKHRNWREEWPAMFARAFPGAKLPGEDAAPTRMRIEPYDDSDPLVYFDPIIQADMGDICLRADEYGMSMCLMTRGLPSFGGISETAARKLNYSLLSNYADASVPVCGSANNIKTAIAGARRMAALEKLYGRSCCIIAIAGTKRFAEYEAELESLYDMNGGPMRWHRIDPIGRAALLPPEDLEYDAQEADRIRDRWRRRGRDISHLTDRFSNSYIADGTLQLDAFGRMHVKRVIGSAISREPRPLDIYGRRAYSPDEFRRIARGR